MTDRELLEAAARAAGYTLAWSSVEGIPPRKADDMETWDPLTDDGDALRLAVRIPGIDLKWFIAAAWQSHDDDDARRAYVRLAIVRAAAEIGRNMK